MQAECGVREAKPNDRFKFPREERTPAHGGHRGARGEPRGESRCSASYGKETYTSSCSLAFKIQSVDQSGLDLDTMKSSVELHDHRGSVRIPLEGRRSTGEKTYPTHSKTGGVHPKLRGTAKVNSMTS